jgi:hypothetical protein
MAPSQARGGPARSTRLELGQLPPIVARRREDVDHLGAFRAGDERVWRVARNPPRRARRELALLVTDAEAHRATQHHPELLVRVPMLRKRCAGLDLDDREREQLPVHRARHEPLEQLLRRDLGEVVEGAHRRIVSSRYAVQLGQ